jgi:hypothetical protein
MSIILIFVPFNVLEQRVFNSQTLDTVKFCHRLEARAHSGVNFLVVSRSAELDLFIVVVMNFAYI